MEPGFVPSTFVLASLQPLEWVPSGPMAWVLVGLLAYWLGIIFLRQNGLMPESVGGQGPILTFHTQRGKGTLERLSAHKRFWRAWANAGVGVSLVVMATMFVFMLVSAYAALQVREGDISPAYRPRNALAIPGVNDFLPLSATPEIALGLFVGLVVHEGGHGLLCRVEDIEIESMGIVMLAILPVGAFVQPDEESNREASRGGQTRMFAAGVTNNFAVTLVAFVLLFSLVGSLVTVAPGAAVGGVAPGTPAADANVEPYDRITAVEGESVASNAELIAVLESVDPGETVTVERNGAETTEIEPGLPVGATFEGALLDAGDVIRRVNGQPVLTQNQALEAVGDEEVATLTVDRADGDREELEVPIGAAMVVSTDGPLEAAGAPAGERFVLTDFDGERVRTAEAFQAAIGETGSGDEVTVAGYLDGERVAYDVTLGTNPQLDTGVGFLGVQSSLGVSGFTVVELGIERYPAEQFLAVLGGGDGGAGDGGVVDRFLSRSLAATALPFNSMADVASFDFPGFTGGIQNFYDVRGPFGGVGEAGVFFAANVLFWTAWINLMLAFFNCIPAFPLDGGHILRTSTEAVLTRFPFRVTRGHVRIVTTTIGLTMLASLLAVLFAPFLLAG